VVVYLKHDNIQTLKAKFVFSIHRKIKQNRSLQWCYNIAKLTTKTSSQEQAQGSYIHELGNDNCVLVLLICVQL
jgi:hypothetical protein